MTMQTTDSPAEMSLNFYQTTWHHIPQDSNILLSR